MLRRNCVHGLAWTVREQSLRGPNTAAVVLKAEGGHHTGQSTSEGHPHLPMAAYELECNSCNTCIPVQKGGEGVSHGGERQQDWRTDNEQRRHCLEVEPCVHKVAAANADHPGNQYARNLWPVTRRVDVAVGSKRCEREGLETATSTRTSTDEGCRGRPARRHLGRDADDAHTAARGGLMRREVGRIEHHGHARRAEGCAEHAAGEARRQRRRGARAAGGLEAWRRRRWRG